MATLITPLNRDMRYGERRFAQRLKDKLDAECLCWFNVRVHATHHPDFILFDPRKGVWTLEVKGWKIGDIQTANPQSVILNWNGGTRQDHNPLEQARSDVLRVVDRLKEDPLLVDTTSGQLLFPWTYGCVFPYITRKQFDAEGLGAVLTPHHVICQDEMAETVDPADFYKRLIRMQPFSNRSALSDNQVNRVRFHIFPEIRIGDQKNFFSSGGLQEENTIKVMDLQQERLARSLGDGHRIIHGVAGSGKTMVLLNRALQLAELPNIKILMLCYNWPIAHYLKQIIKRNQAEGRVDVFHFHEWCRQLLRGAGLENSIPIHNDEEGSSLLVQKTLEAASKRQIAHSQYQAIMLDEGHDFREHPDWFGLILDMLDPDPSSPFVIAYDDAQSIYDKSKNFKFSFKSVGVNAQGRTTILRKNYRNTYEILQFAKRFAGTILDDHNAEDGEVETLCPESAGRHGPEPQVMAEPSFDDEAEKICRYLIQQHDAGVPWKDMAVGYRWNQLANYLVPKLMTHAVPFWQKGASHGGYDPHADSVKLMTMHAMKGLEFPVVCLMGIGGMPGKREADEEKRVLYVALTRSTEKLLLTYSHDSSFAKAIAAISARS